MSDVLFNELVWSKRAANADLESFGSDDYRKRLGSAQRFWSDERHTPNSSNNNLAHAWERIVYAKCRMNCDYVKIPIVQRWTTPRTSGGTRIFVWGGGEILIPLS